MVVPPDLDPRLVLAPALLEVDPTEVLFGFAATFLLTAFLLGLAFVFEMPARDEVVLAAPDLAGVVLLEEALVAVLLLLFAPVLLV